ncbi:hypothetical protein E2C01_066117 [Portunus trituberculatus]|uniref:Uncharacterized protein n=1 Tax=Portunus trituberculatus TaxID=210409 RepID=A0A5B7HRF5_PORTR|nr:hypothetical protein [Portunus trituberculatus]
MSSTAPSSSMCPDPPRASPQASAMWEPRGLTSSLDPCAQALPAPWQPQPSLVPRPVAPGRHWQGQMGGRHQLRHVPRTVSPQTLPFPPTSSLRRPSAGPPEAPACRRLRVR